VTFLLGFAPLGIRPIFLAILFCSDDRDRLAGAPVAGRHARSGEACSLWPWSPIRPCSPWPANSLTPLDEGMVMDMPITVPRASVTESVDDMKARNMVLCRFPEVDMVVGKAGRADTPTDPAPMDMIETMVNFRPQELWPRPQAEDRGRRDPRPRGC